MQGSKVSWYRYVLQPLKWVEKPLKISLLDQGHTGVNLDQIHYLTKISKSIIANVVRSKLIDTIMISKYILLCRIVQFSRFYLLYF